MSSLVLPRETRVELRCGRLTLQVRQADMPLEELCTFGSRRNRKRAFLFISKVLGKHVPVRPAQMEGIHQALARKLECLQGPVLFVGLAETAIGLGQGVFESWLDWTGRRDAFFVHSTRYRLPRPLAFSFGECHSHAPEHLVYFPDTQAKEQIFRQARTLVLVDDEITTARTLANLAGEFLKLNPHLLSIRFLSITNWLNPESWLDFGCQLDREVLFHQILQGCYHFSPKPAFDPGPIPHVIGALANDHSHLQYNHGRLGVIEPMVPDFSPILTEMDPRPGERFLVLGTGEFVHLPYLLARQMERAGFDVHFQSTTRSPVLVGEGIASALEFTDNYHDEIPNFVYNVANKPYDRIWVCYETYPLPTSHCLPAMVGGKALFF